MAMVDWDDETLFSYSIPQMPTSISVIPESAMIALGSTKQLACTVSPESAVQDVTWQSSNEAVATVDADGLVTTVSKGTVKIIATSVNGLKDTCDVKVYDANGYETIDLGLPSGNLWCTMNIGADSINGNGDYYAWGETTTKYDEGYSWGTYKWSTTLGALTKYNSNSNYGTVDYKTVLEPEDDAAIVNMKGDWQMPAPADFRELLDNTKVVKISKYNGSNVTCYVFYKKKASGEYSLDDLHMVLPIAGTIGDGGTTDDNPAKVPGMVNSYCKYWTTTKQEWNYLNQTAIYFDDLTLSTSNGATRFQGMPIRAVIKK